MKSKKIKNIMYHDKTSHKVGDKCPVCHPTNMDEKFMELMESLGVKFIDVTNNERKIP